MLTVAFNLGKPKSSLTVSELFHLVHTKEKKQNLLKIAVNSKVIPPKKRMLLSKYIK